jgi:hypothetical protein
VLAGIGKVESDHGRSPAPGVRAGLNWFGCCAGPMQFNLVNGPPSTWQGWSRPGDDVYDPADAIPAAARKLCADGLGPGVQATTWARKRGGDPCPTVRGSAAQHRGHSRFVKGTTRVSNHTVWRAVDLDMVDGRPVSRANRAARELVAWIDKLSGPLRPAEVGSPFAEYAPQPMYFSDDGHQFHVHIGYGYESGIFQQTKDSGR